MRKRERIRLHVRWLQRESDGATEYASVYDAENASAHFYRMRLRRASDLLTDAGCGPGNAGDLFRSRPIAYHGIDVWENRARMCIDRHGADGDKHVFPGRTEEWPFRP